MIQSRQQAAHRLAASVIYQLSFTLLYNCDFLYPKEKTGKEIERMRGREEGKRYNWERKRERETTGSYVEL